VWANGADVSYVRNLTVYDLVLHRPSFWNRHTFNL
jgi:hypothetical protein